MPSTLAVVRPSAVNPMTSPFVSSRKCSCHGSFRGWNNRVNSPVSGSMPDRFVAEVARKRQIISRVCTVMLPGNNVLDMKSDVRIVALVDSAVLAMVSGAFANETPRFVIHLWAEARERAFRRMKATKSMYSTYLSYSRASAGERVPSFAFSASSSTRAWNSGFGLGSSAKCFASSGVNPCVMCSTNLSSAPTGSLI